MGVECTGRMGWVQCLQDVVSAIQLFTSDAKTVYLRRSIRVSDSFSRSSLWGRRGNVFDLGA